MTVSATPPTNAAPVVTSTPGTTATVGQPYVYTATATDADSDPVQFFLTSGPTGFAIAPGGVVTWTPAANQTGAQAITIEARDGKGGVTPQSFSVTVSAAPPTNAAPVVTSTPVTTATVGQPYAYTATATDADSDPVTFVLVERAERVRHRARRRGDVDAGGDPDGRAGDHDRGAGRQGRRHAAELQRDGERDAADQCRAGRHRWVRRRPSRCRPTATLSGSVTDDGPAAGRGAGHRVDQGRAGPGP